jgi:hypothetical protein
MNSEFQTGIGVASGRNWAARPADGAPIEWSVDAAQGHLQGPLALEFLHDKRMTLVLAAGQQALLVRDGQLLAVFLDGAHHLAIGDGEGLIPSTCQLVFLATDEPLILRWTSANPLSWGPHAEESLIGSCALRIERSGRFFETFLQGQTDHEPDFVTRLIDQLVRGVFEELLSTGTGLDVSETQARLTRLSPSDLNDDLEACGLFCSHLAVYTAHPPVEVAPACAH